VFRKAFENVSFKAAVTRSFKTTFYISSTRALGTYSVRVRIYAAGTTKLLSDRVRADTFRVKA
jgi:hypothetical protein